MKGDEYVIDKVIEGETVADVLEYVQFTPKRMARTVEVWVTTSVKKGIISAEEGREFLSNYRSGPLWLYLFGINRDRDHRDEMKYLLPHRALLSGGGGKISRMLSGIAP